MSFADAYLQRHGTGEALIAAHPDPATACIVIIPAFNESRLTDCLDLLFNTDPIPFNSEVIVGINYPEDANRDVLAMAENSFESAVSWAAAHKRSGITFHPLLLKDLPRKHFGAGLARKILMDEAVRRFNRIDRKDGVIISLDADTAVMKNYLRAIHEHYQEHPEQDGCSINFAHPIEGDSFPRAVYDAVVNYELHQRYYLEAVRYTGYPFAFHTVGSCFSVKAESYCAQGGMNKRQAGEDFYFIQKIAMQGRYGECNTTTVMPSPRPSMRVPFGTGPDISRQLEQDDSTYFTYEPKLFEMLKEFYSLLPEFRAADDPLKLTQKLDPLVQEYLINQDFGESLDEIRNNTSGAGSFSTRFMRKFNMFWILKFLHHAADRGTGKRELADAAGTMIRMMDPGITVLPHDKRGLLSYYRKLHLQHHHNH